MLINLLILWFLILLSIININSLLTFNLGDPMMILLLICIIIWIIISQINRHQRAEKKTENRDFTYYGKFILCSTIAIIIGCIVGKIFLIGKAWEANLYLRLYGRISFLFIAISLAMTPLMASIKNIKIKMELPLVRKTIWILAFVFAIKHMIAYFGNEITFAGHSTMGYYAYIFSNLLTRNDALTWLIAAILIIILWVTSNMYSVKLLWGKLWTTIQSLAYPLFVLASIHIAFSSRFDAFYIITIVMLVALRTTAYFGKIENK